MGLKNRSFTCEFKKELVEQILHRSVSISKLSREHNVHRRLLYRWIDHYHAGTLKSGHAGRPPITATRKAEIKDLEQLVGRLMIDNELLKKALKVVEEQQKPNEIISGTIEIPLDQSQGGVEC